MSAIAEEEHVPDKDCVSAITTLQTDQLLACDPSCDKFLQLNGDLFDFMNGRL